MLKSLSFLILITFYTLPLWAKALSCRNFVSVPFVKLKNLSGLSPWMGTLVKAPPKFIPFNSRDQVFVLGSQSAGRVYRSSSSSREAKTYKHFFGPNIKGPEDHNFLQLLRENQSAIPFRIIQSIVLRDDLLELETIYGISLEQIFSMKMGTKEQRGDLAFILGIGLLELAQWHNRRPEKLSKAVYSDQLMTVMFPYDGSSTRTFNIHPGNVLLDLKTGELVIIDPR